MGNEQHTCSTGICVDFSGTDVNTGIGNFPGNHTKDECFTECQKMRNKLSTKMTGCEHKHGIECHYHTKPIANGNGREGSTCCVFEHKTKYIQSVNEKHMCTTGICLDKNGIDINSDMGNFPGNHTKEECFVECQKARKRLFTNMTGCEHKNGIECHYHTKPIGKGNGREGATCCVYEHVLHGMYFD